MHVLCAQTIITDSHMVKNVMVQGLPGLLSPGRKHAGGDNDMGIGALESKGADASRLGTPFWCRPGFNKPRRASGGQHHRTLPTRWGCSKGGCCRPVGMLAKDACNEWVEGAQVQEWGRVGLQHAGSQMQQADQAGGRFSMPHRGLGS